MKTTISRAAFFGPYEVDVRSGEVRKHGIRVKIGEQPFQILLMLLASPGELVLREELRAKLWAGDTFVDFDHGLNSAVQRLRDCLSDTAEKPLWIETVPRRGYRFIGQVEWLPGAAGPSPHNGEGAALRANVAPDQQVEVAAATPLPAPQRSRTKPFRSTAIWIVVAVVLLLAWPLIRVAARWKTVRSDGSARIRSIAVLPLENLSGDPAQDYFADGMTDELITTLAKNHALRITSRTSVMRYKAARQPIRDIAGELGVDGVIVGSVARSGNRVRVNVQLIQASNDSHLWSESYERDLGDTLSLQDQLARAIADQVQVTAAPLDAARPGAAPRFNPEAHDAYLRGRYAWYQGDYPKSRQFFQKAIDLDPAYAPGYSGLADSYIGQCVSGGLPASEGMPIGEAAAHKALEIDDSLAEAHNSLAAAKLFYHWDWPGAEKEVTRALELNPSYSEAHHLYNYVLSVTNRAPEGLQQERIAQALDPFARPWAIGFALFRERRFDDAIQAFRSELGNEPDDPDLHQELAEAYYFKGMLKESIKEYETSATLQGDANGAAALESIYQSAGYNATLEWSFALLKKKAKDQYVSPMQLADLSAALGRQNEAIRYLEEAFDQHTARLVWLKQNPYLDSLHSDPRYQAIVKRVGLP
jgi:TolB-like protein/DNA-binding winged helix-turn-helix (wHTH) protein